MKEQDIIQLLKSINNSEYLFYKVYESLLEEYCFLETRSTEERTADQDKIPAEECIAALNGTGLFHRPTISENENETVYTFRFRDIAADIPIYKFKERNWEKYGFYTARIHFDCTGETLVGLPLRVRHSDFKNMITDLARHIPLWEKKLEQLNIDSLQEQIRNENRRFFNDVGELLDENDTTHDWSGSTWGGELYINLSYGRYARISINPDMGIDKIKAFIKLVKTLEQTLKQFEDTEIVIKDRLIESNGVDYTDYYTPISFVDSTF